MSKLSYYKEEVEVSCGKLKRIIKCPKFILELKTKVAIADGLGNNQLCGWKKCVQANCMCTGAFTDSCVTYRDCDDHKHKCVFLTWDFTFNVPPKARAKLSFYDVSLIAFDSLSFWCNTSYINSNTPPELLHEQCLGAFQFLI